MADDRKEIGTWLNTAGTWGDVTIDSTTPLQRVDLRLFRDYSAQLEQFRTRNFGSMDAEIRRVMPRASLLGQLPPPVYLPVVDRACRDLAPQYVRPPLRVYSGLSSIAERKVRRVWKRGRFNSVLREASARLQAQRSQLFAIDITGTNQARLVALSPFEVSVRFADPLETDIARAEEVRVLVPWQTVEDRGRQEILYATRVYRQDRAWVELPDDRRTPLFGDREEHAFGRIPLVATRKASPSRRGQWFPDLAFDMLYVQVALCIHVSDILNVLQVQGPGRDILIGSDPKKLDDIPLGVGVMNLFNVAEDAEQRAVFQHIQPNPIVDKWITALRFTIEAFESLNVMSPGSLLQGAGITGAAKAWEMLPVQEERARSEEDYESLEQDLLELLIVQLNADEGQAVSAGVADDVEVDLTWRYVEPASNNLQDAQARSLRYGLGLESVVKDFAKRHGIGFDEARGELVANLAENATLLTSAAMEQGADKTAGTMPPGRPSPEPNAAPPEG